MKGLTSGRGRRLSRANRPGRARRIADRGRRVADRRLGGHSRTRLVVLSACDSRGRATPAADVIGLTRELPSHPSAYAPFFYAEGW